ncbi:MAG TPA: DUF5666 domain-containing protein [Candidatus Limnocylindrales bacterium]
MSEQESTNTSFSATFKGPDLLRIGVVIGASAILLASAALTMGASPQPSGSSPAPSAGSPSVGDSNPDLGLPGLRFGMGPGGMRDFRIEVDGSVPGVGSLGGSLNGRGCFRGILGQVSITAVNGSSISLKTDNGWTRTIAVTGSTTITKGGQAIGVGDLRVGDVIDRLNERRNSDGTFTIVAIDVAVPRVAGTVAALTSGGFTVTARDGSTWTVTVTDATKYSVGKNGGSRSDVKAGLVVEVEGTSGSGNSITASTVRVQPAMVFGEVTAKTSSTITLSGRDGSTTTVHVDGSTSYTLPGVDSAGLSDITVGMQIVAQGTKRTDGSLDASAILAGPRLERGFGHGFGRGFGIVPKSPSEVPAPNATSAPSGEGTSG